MRSLTVAVVLSFCLFGAAIASDAQAFDSFVSFMKQYGKSYSQVEMPIRFENFKASLKRIEEKNAKSKGATYGITQFSDMSTDEFRATVLMKNPITANMSPRDPSKVLKTKLAAADLPAVFDWRDLGAVTAVKNQEQCGSCWAFSVTENIESMWILKNKTKNLNDTLALAPQQIVDCDESDLGCDGGNPPTAYEYVISAGGLDTEASYPYTAEDGNCAFKKNDVAAKISNWQYATELYSETELQNNLVGWGPLSVCLDAQYWQDYTSGVMTWTECAWINTLDHCVQLVGYNSEASTPYWVVRNSWGTTWGVEGYIYLEMWEDTCGIAHEATCSIV